MFKVDIFVLKNDLVSQNEMNRRQPYQVDSQQAFFVSSAEDIIIQKLHWFQLGGKISERQWNDILGVFQVQKETLDYLYLQKSAKLKGVAELLEQAIKETGI
jgi:hypothetical protein